MIDVATLSVIRRWALREQMSIREISRRTGLARNTVKSTCGQAMKSPATPGVRAPASSIHTPTNFQPGYRSRQQSRANSGALCCSSTHTDFCWASSWWTYPLQVTLGIS